MPYATQRPRPGPYRPRGPAYRTAVAQVRARAQAGEVCWFWQRDPQCTRPGFDWTLHPNHVWAFTAHHLERVMDGGHPEPDPRLMAPAHRGCNARDGLRAQNARRAGRRLGRWTHQPERTSRVW
jgi:hypothetical protein